MLKWLFHRDVDLDYTSMALGVNGLDYFRKGSKITIMIIIIIMAPAIWGELLYTLYFKDNYNNSSIVYKFTDKEVSGQIL